MTLFFHGQAGHNDGVPNPLTWVIRLGLIAGLGLTGVAGAWPAPAEAAQLTPALADVLAHSPAGTPVAVIAEVSAPGPVLARLRAWEAAGRAQAVTALWIVNAVGFAADAATVRQVAGWPEVRRLAVDAVLQLAEPPESAAAAPAAGPLAVAPNLTAINAPLLWSQGITGTDVVIATLDTGVDGTHPDLAARWRGGAADWFDPYQQCATPCDLHGHGTQVLGVVVAGAESGTALGVAPGAQWIAARIFNASQQATTSAIHQAFQWALDPDGNPATDDAPDVVNASWDVVNPGGCDLTFAPDIQALTVAGIITVYAAGNSGPGAASAVSPANNPEALPVGAVDNAGQVAGFSSRGPTSCGTAQARFFPELAAPGVQVPTTDRMVAGDPAARYIQASGTSLAAPHVTGALALLLSAFPNQRPSAAELRVALSYTARPLPAAGQAPNNDTGAGLLDVAAAYAALGAGTLPTATPSATPTLAAPTATPSATPTPIAGLWGRVLFLPWVAAGLP